MKMITIRRIRRAGLTVLRPSRAVLRSGDRPTNVHGPGPYPVERAGGFSIHIPRTHEGDYPAGWRVGAPTEAALAAGLARLGLTCPGLAE